jgi:hypothetical protein
MAGIFAAACLQRDRVVSEIPVSFANADAVTAFGPINHATARAFSNAEYSFIFVLVFAPLVCC